jgi:hypothetical protein
MSSNPSPPAEVAEIKAQVPPPQATQTDGLFGAASMDDWAEKKVDDIEMIGEEVAAGYRPPGHSEVTAGMRYLHCSRTIHQLVSDRNRAVGIYIAVATLLWTATAALLNARPIAELPIPIDTIQRACLPVTFATMTLLAVFVAFLLIRTRVGLIYEVAKMNVLLNLPIGRVKRINPLSIFFIMQAFISVGGGVSAALLALSTTVVSLPIAILIGIVVGVLLLLLYVGTIRHTTSDEKLQGDSQAPRS